MGSKIFIFFALCIPICFAYPSALLITLKYDANLSHIELKKLKVIYATRTPYEGFANANIAFLSDSNEVIYDENIPLAPRIVIIDPPLEEYYSDLNVSGTYEHEFLLPYLKEAKALLIRTKGRTFYFEIANRLCNGNGICDTEESFLSCADDCNLSEPDGVCLAEKDSVCDPDCDATADVDCVEKILRKKTTPIAVQTKTPVETTPIATIPKEPEYGTIITSISIAALAIIIAIALYFGVFSRWQKAQM